MERMEHEHEHFDLINLLKAMPQPRTQRLRLGGAINDEVASLASADDPEMRKDE